VVDLRPESPTFKQWHSVELTTDNLRALYIPQGCAHGFITLEDETLVNYVINGQYHPASARGVRWNDPLFSIEWEMQPVVINARDANYPDFGE
jgi:dTDP-4-dehydrorhamnose 3,5-epimerase